MVELVTERLLLRRARIDDLNPFHALLSDKHATRYWSTPPHSEIGETRAWLGAMISAPPDESNDFVVEHDGVFIGKAGFFQLPEIGFIFRPDYWARGFAFEALTAVIGDTFDRFALSAVTADTDPRNAPSLRLLSKLGFVETGRAKKTLKYGDEWCDSIYLRLEREAFAGAQRRRR